jgi:hypothetical protein
LTEGNEIGIDDCCCNYLLVNQTRFEREGLTHSHQSSTSNACQGTHDVQKNHIPRYGTPETTSHEGDCRSKKA